jgi:hypothetical protein
MGIAAGLVCRAFYPILPGLDSSEEVEGISAPCSRFGVKAAVKKRSVR